MSSTTYSHTRFVNGQHVCFIQDVTHTFWHLCRLSLLVKRGAATEFWEEGWASQELLFTNKAVHLVRLAVSIVKLLTNTWWQICVHLFLLSILFFHQVGKSALIFEPTAYSVCALGLWCLCDVCWHVQEQLLQSARLMKRLGPSIWVAFCTWQTTSKSSWLHDESRFPYLLCDKYW